jgi:hypothetical protein
MKFKKGFLYGLKNKMFGYNIHKLGNTGLSEPHKIFCFQKIL